MAVLESSASLSEKPRAIKGTVAIVTSIDDIDESIRLRYIIYRASDDCTAVAGATATDEEDFAEPEPPSLIEKLEVARAEQPEIPIEDCLREFGL